MDRHVFVITGAGRGIGFEMVNSALSNGHQVFAGVRNLGRAKELTQLAARSENRLVVLELDVVDDESAKRFATAIGTRTKYIDVLVNNAGVFLDREDDSTSVSAKTVLDSLNTNAVGAIRVTQACLPLLKKSSGAKVVNISSKMGSIDDTKSGGNPAYRMSKAAMNMFTKTFSIDESDIITICMHPGWVKTEMGGSSAPLEKAASVEGIMKVIAGVTAKQSGHFINYDGTELPW